MASGLFADFCSDDQLRAHDESGAPFMRELWQQAVAAGLHMVIVAEADGGLGLGMTELMAVLEQQGRALALLPLWEQQLAAATLARFGSAPQVVGQAMAGDLPLALSLTLSLTAAAQRRWLDLVGHCPGCASGSVGPPCLVGSGGRRPDALVAGRLDAGRHPKA